MIICICMNVDENRLREEINNLAQNSMYGMIVDDIVNYLKAKTKACTQCGCCEQQIKELINEN